MSLEYITVEQSLNLNGEAELAGAKNAVLVIMSSLILTSGVSRLTRVPASSDVFNMIKLLEGLGARVYFDQAKNMLEVDTSNLFRTEVSFKIMNKMRASVLVMGPLLARFKKAEIALPGGCVIGARPIDLHLKSFKKMGATVTYKGDYLITCARSLNAYRIVLDYPSVGATENILMAAALTQGTTHIINAALEPEVLDLITVMKKMGANITVKSPQVIEIKGVSVLKPIDHAIMYDRLEAGSLILAAAVTQGSIALPNAPAYALDVFLAKLQEMGHGIKIGPKGHGVWFSATKNPQAVSFKTMPYPGFPTDLQAPMMVALTQAKGASAISETVFENRFLHVKELCNMGANITLEGNSYAIVKGYSELYGTSVQASDIRAACALILAGLTAQGKTTITGIHHLHRGYQNFVHKLQLLGAKISFSRPSKSKFHEATL